VWNNPAFQPCAQRFGSTLAARLADSGVLDNRERRQPDGYSSFGVQITRSQTFFFM
jgi:hypothetical protein